MKKLNGVECGVKIVPLLSRTRRMSEDKGKLA